MVPSVVIFFTAAVFLIRVSTIFILLGVKGSRLSKTTTPSRGVAQRMVCLIALAESIVTMAKVPRNDLTVGGVVLMSKVPLSMKIQFAVNSVC